MSFFFIRYHRFFHRLTKMTFLLTALKELYLNNNKLETLPFYIAELPNLEKLTTFILKYNKLVDLPDSIILLQKLTGLDLGYNYLSKNNLPSKTLKWADTFDPDWAKTQFQTSIEYAQKKPVISNFKIVNYSNSFQLQLSLTSINDVEIQIFIANGKRIQKNKYPQMSPGTHLISINKNIPTSGAYFLKVNVGGETVAFKAIGI